MSEMKENSLEYFGDDKPAAVVELRMPMRDIEANVVLLDARGDVIDVDVERILIRPIFFNSKQVANAIYGKLYIAGSADGEVRQQFTLGVSGTAGRCKLQQRSNPVTPQFAIDADDDDEEEDEDE